MADDDAFRALMEHYYGGSDPRAAYRDPSIQKDAPLGPTLDPLPQPELKEWNPGPYLQPAFKGAAEGIAGMAKTPADVAGSGIELGLNSYYGKPGAAALNAAELAAMLVPGFKGGIGHNRGPAMEGKLPWSAPRVEPTVPNIPLSPGNKYGFYSKLEDALHRFSDTDTVTPKKLSEMGVSKAEIQARLPGFTEGTKAADLHALAAENPVELRENRYGATPYQVTGGRTGRSVIADAPTREIADRIAAAHSGSVIETGATTPVAGRAKWGDWATDPSPTANYGESVLHMPAREAGTEARLATVDAEARAIEEAGGLRFSGGEPANPQALARYKTLEAEAKQLHAQASAEQRGNFRSGHWDEPNAIAHTRYSTLKDVYGKPVLLADEIQSDWGQKLREGGVRDEAKIADLGKRLEDAEQYHATASMGADDFLTKNRGDLEGADFWNEGGKRRKPPSRQDEQLDLISEYGPNHLQGDAQMHLMDIVRAREEAKLLRAEYETARASTPGHPLVNTTDQWTTTAMRHLLQKAHEAGAEGIALTPGAVQNERFNLAKQISGLAYDPERGSLRYRQVPPAGSGAYSGWQHYDGAVKPADLPSTVGKELAEKLLAQPAEGGTHYLHDLGNAEIGGQGMKYAYDQMYPKQLEKMLRKMDPQHPGRSETRLVPSDFDPAGMVGANGQLNRIGHKYQRYQDMADGTPFANPFHYFPLTPKVREAIERGLPLFSEGGAVPSLRDYYGDKP